MSEYMLQGDPPNFTDEAKITYWKSVINESEQLVLSKGHKKKEIEQKSNSH